MAIQYAKQKPPPSISKHYTPRALAAHLISLVPISSTDTVLDPAAGASRAFFDQFGVRRRIACEIAEGVDFLAMPLAYDWAITNPPYHLLWKFIEKSASEAQKGFAFLININGFNSLTPRRLRRLGDQQLQLRRIHVCQVRKWFGRYYFVVFERGVIEGCTVSWDDESWDD